MPRLPQVGGDDGSWGQILNDFLLTSLTTDGAIKQDSITSDQLKSGAVTPAKITGLGQTNGIATLGGDGKLASSQIPDYLSAESLENYIDEAEASADTASNAATTASQAATNAGNAATSADTHKTAAEAARTDAQTARNEAQTARTGAETAETNAEAAQASAETARNETIVSVGAQQDWSGAVTLSQSETRSTFVRRRLAGNATLSLANGIANQAYTCTLEIQQDATGGRALALINVRTSYGVAFSVTSLANASDIIYLLWNGSYWTASLGVASSAVPSAWAA